MNSNRLRHIPSELGRLEMLEELVLGENALEDLPHTIELMANLRVLKLSNNRLRSLPNELAEIVTLEVVDCSNNPDLDMVPARWRGDTDSIMFTCRVHRGYAIKLAELMQTNDDLAKHAQYLEQEQLVMKESMGNLRHEIEEVRRHLPKKIAQKLAAEAKAREQIIDTGEEKKSFCVIS
jgi:Leucine-rich repeat (LRR) protein